MIDPRDRLQVLMYGEQRVTCIHSMVKAEVVTFIEDVLSIGLRQVIRAGGVGVICPLQSPRTHAKNEKESPH